MKVCVNGYGTIGKRIADAISLHKKMELAGISKYTADNDAKMAQYLGYDIYVPSERRTEFEKKGIRIKGTVDEMVDASDIIVDASADGMGAKNKELYAKKSKPAIFQGGEEENIVEMSFNARSNFNEANGKKFIRVVSCNTTSFSRVLKPLQENFKIKKVNSFLMRRGADPNDSKGSRLNSVEWQANSHHAHDVNTVMSIPMTSFAFKVPHTLTHVNSLYVHFDESPSLDKIKSVLKKESRIILANAKSSSEIIETARDLGFGRYDLYMPVVMENSMMLEGNTLFFTMLVPQESVVVPENLDAIIAQSGAMNQKESMEATDKALGLDKIKKAMEAVYG